MQLSSDLGEKLCSFRGESVFASEAEGQTGTWILDSLNIRRERATRAVVYQLKYFCWNLEHLSSAGVDMSFIREISRISILHVRTFTTDKT